MANKDHMLAYIYFTIIVLLYNVGKQSIIELYCNILQS